MGKTLNEFGKEDDDYASKVKDVAYKHFPDMAAELKEKGVPITGETSVRIEEGTAKTTVVMEFKHQ